MILFVKKPRNTSELIQGDNENYVKTSSSRALVVYFVLILVRLKKGVLIVGLEL